MSILLRGLSIFKTPCCLTRCYAYYITTPIFYVNSSPHIGHVHTFLLADALNRYQRLRLKTNDTLFSTGTDEHGIKIQTAAEAKGIDYNTFCDMNAEQFINLFKQYDTTLTNFIRTSEIEHIRAVQTVWTQLQEAGYIYKSTYSGWYCASDEVFVPESQVTQEEVGGKIKHVNQDKHPVVWSEEENFIFRLTSVSENVLKWLVDTKPILPTKFNDEAVSMLKHSTLGDISISRPKSRLKWGIEVPGDPNHTIYVWLDALINYLTVVGYPNSVDQLKRWPIDCQVLGKDIIKFHAIYWPAFLTALSLPLPRRLFCHSHWLIDSMKMSKSRGNVVDPNKENELLTPEGLRYYLLRVSPPHSDTDYNQVQAVRRLNSEMADTFGNLLSRACAPAINPKQVIPTKIDPSYKSNDKMVELEDALSSLRITCQEHYDAANLYLGIDCIMAVLRLNNALYEHAKPWKLVKESDTNDDSKRNYLNLQAITFETLRICAILLQPIIPNLTDTALKRLNVCDRWWEDARLKLDIGDPGEDCRMVNQEASSIVYRRIKT